MRLDNEMFFCHLKVDKMSFKYIKGVASRTVQFILLRVCVCVGVPVCVSVCETLGVCVCVCVCG